MTQEEQREKIIGIIQDSVGGCARNWAEIIANALLSNGVIVPPCKVGDVVYVVSQGQGFCMRWNVYEGKVVDIHLNRHKKLTIRVENGEKFFGYFETCFIYKTKEEAEQALKEREVK